MLVQAGQAASESEAEQMLKTAIDSGAAFEKFKAMVKAQNGDTAQIDHPDLLPCAKHVTGIISPVDGFVRHMTALEFGRLAMEIGAGRATKEDVIDPAAGIVLNKKVGDRVMAGDVLAWVHHDQPLTRQWQQAFFNAYDICSEAVCKEPLIYKVL